MTRFGGEGMDATALRELQAPLKAAYRERPEAALVTLKAAGDLAEGAIACKVETGRALIEAGLHPATGGSGLERTAPVGFREIRLAFDLDTDEPPERLDTLLKLTERYCVVLQTLRNAPPIAATIARRVG